MEDDLIRLVLLNKTAIDNGGGKSEQGDCIELHDDAGSSGLIRNGEIVSFVN